MDMSCPGNHPSPVSALLELNTQGENSEMEIRGSWVVAHGLGL